MVRRSKRKPYNMPKPDNKNVDASQKIMTRKSNKNKKDSKKTKHKENNEAPRKRIFINLFKSVEDRSDELFKLPETCFNFVEMLSKKSIFNIFKTDMLRLIDELEEKLNLNMNLCPYVLMMNPSSLNFNLFFSILLKIFQSHLHNHSTDEEIHLKYKTLSSLSGYSLFSWQKIFNLYIYENSPREEDLKYLITDCLFKGLSKLF
jgi:hypothetical protein